MKICSYFIFLCYIGVVKSKPRHVRSEEDPETLDVRKIHLKPQHIFRWTMNGKNYLQSTHLSVSNGDLNKVKMIEVLIKLSDNFCGGTIISNKFILTAAHCFVTREYCSGNDESTVKASIVPLNKIQVLIEGTCHPTEDAPCDKNDEGKAVAAKNVYILTEYYEKKCTSGDLAIIELEDIIGDHGAKLSVDQNLPQSGKFMVSGFGHDPNDTAATDHLLKTVTLTAQKCESDLGFPDSICTEEIDKDVCRGDSGGALVDEQNVIFGVVSSGTSCSTIYTSMLNRESENEDYKKFSGGTFTAVSRHLGFICEVIGEFENCPKTFTKEPFLKV